jgi:HAD-superfamily hydrolase, subfamily IIB
MAQKNYKLLVLDVDGTLLNDKKEISKYTHASLMKAQNTGIRVVLASGRPTCGVKPVAETLELEKYGGYYMSYNGSKIFDASSGQLIYEKSVEPEIMPFLQKEAGKYGLAMFTYNRNIILTDSPDNKYIRQEAELNKMQIVETKQFSDDPGFTIHKVMMVGEPEKLIPLEKRMQKRLNGTVNVFHSEPYFLEFAPENIDKANTLGVLLDKINVSANEIIAIGDGTCDYGMIQLAGLGIAMGNAQTSVKACADYTTLSNNEDGVAVAVETAVLSVLPPPNIILKQLNANTGRSLIGNLGIEYTYASSERVEAIMPVDHRTRQPFGILHGGASLALAETLAGVGSMLGCSPDELTVGMQVSGNHVSSAHEGDTVRAVATIIHKGRSSHVWNVDIFTSTDKLVSSIRVINSILKRK